MNKKPFNPMRGIVLARFRSVSAAAAAIGVGRRRLSDVCDGKLQMTVDEAIDIASACGVDISDVFAASRHMREMYSSQCVDGSYQTEGVTKNE